jgi:glutathione peroxidase-family protein
VRAGGVSFACLTVHKNWTALAPEDSLIKRYRQQSSEVCEWNGNSFGPHDPGRERETSNKAPDGFDAQFPIRDDWPCDSIEPRGWNVRELLIQIKKSLPFLLRYEAVKKNYRKGHPSYNDLVVVVPTAAMPVNRLLRLITQSLPGWQSTKFPSHLILYKEAKDYTHGTVIWRQPD